MLPRDLVSSANVVVVAVLIRPNQTQYLRHLQAIETLSLLIGCFIAMQEPLIAPLLKDLQSADESIRDRATQALWRIWFEQKGVLGFEIIQRAQTLLQEGNSAEAEATLTALVQDQPDFAEAWNRRAVLYYTQGHYQQAIADCETVLRLNLVHFGALHGLGLCHAVLGNYPAAIEAFRKATAIQPYALANQRLLLECTMRLG